jgi:carboxymethylenebutenolidase
MQERKVRIATASGSMGTYVFHPDGAGPWPPIVFYMDAPGLRDELRDMARRLAAIGYYVALPDLYYRVGEEQGINPHTPSRSEADKQRMWELIHSLSIAKVVADSEAIIGFLDGERETRPGGIGIVGYCMSGPFVFAVASACPNRIAAAASI